VIKASLVHPEDVAYIWEEVAPLLSKVSRHTEGELEPDDFLEPLTHGDMQLWMVSDQSKLEAAMITQFVEYPQKKILRIISLAGDDFEKIREFQIMVESFAIKTQCSALEMWGRKGWKKLLPDWKDSYVVYTKDLRERMH
tara:strand:- start:699 stop:1118 length:420 start_codon:yes stop_codon:yes gene_type:complete